MVRPSPRIIAAFVGLGALSWTLAFAVDQLAARVLALPEGASLASPSDTTLTDATAPTKDADPNSRSAGPKPPRKSDFIDPIVTRSIFDSTKVGSTASASDGDKGVEGGEVKSDIDASLLATVVADPAQYSSALISHKGGEDAKGYGIGDDLFGEGTVVSVEPRRVIIERNDGSREYIAMDLDAKVQKSTSRVLHAAKGDSEDGVEKVSATKFIVDGDLVEEAMKNPEKLASQIRVSPHKDASGTIDGYRLSGIRRNSLFKKLGIKNGDIVHAVNGQSLTSISSAMNAYESLQNDKNFSFDVTRRNKRDTYEYEIR